MDWEWSDPGGNDAIEKPLKILMDCGDITARMLLAMYAGQDLDRWYGVPPLEFFWHYYKLEGMAKGRFHVLCASAPAVVRPTPIFNRIDPQNQEKSQSCFNALRTLESAGLLYEAVVLLNRNPIPAKFSSGHAYGEIPHDAEILCDLGSPSPFGPVSAIEHGLGNEYLATAKELGWIDKPCNYLALIPTGQPAMIAGLYRLRFRVTHAKNAFIEEATRRHLDANASALRKLNYLRATNNLEPINRTLQSPSILIQSPSIILNTVQSKSAQGGDC